MRYIDAFNHFNPKRYFDELLQSPAGQNDIGKRVRGIPALWDLDLRLKVVDMFADYTQVLSLGMQMVERLWGPDQAPEMAKIANDGLAEVVAKITAFRQDPTEAYDFVVGHPVGVDPHPWQQAGATWCLSEFEPARVSSDQVRDVLRDGRPVVGLRVVSRGR